MQSRILRKMLPSHAITFIPLETVVPPRHLMNQLHEEYGVIKHQKIDLIRPLLTGTRGAMLERAFITALDMVIQNNP
jgi:hypothetical protein